MAICIWGRVGVLYEKERRETRQTESEWAARLVSITEHGMHFFCVNGNPRLDRGGGARAAARARRRARRATYFTGLPYRKKYKGDYNNRRQAAAALRRDAAPSPSTEPSEKELSATAAARGHVPTGVPTALAATAACATSSPR